MAIKHTNTIKTLIALLIMLAMLTPFSYVASADEGINRLEAVSLIIDSLRSGLNLTNEQLVTELAKGGKTISFTDTKAEDAAVASALGIITGISDTAFAPEQPVTREQFAVMLARVSAFINPRQAAEPLEYGDKDKISGWAAVSVDYLSTVMDKEGRRVMAGSDGLFDPGGIVTRQQAMTKISKLHSIMPPSPEAAMILVDGGSFVMGSGREVNLEDPSLPPDDPKHNVVLRDYYISNVEVTQEAFQKVMGFNPSTFKGGDLPVFQITWFDAAAYCNLLSESEGFTNFYNIADVNKDDKQNIIGAAVSVNTEATGYRLPTEAQFIYAAKGGSKSGGYLYAGGNNLNEVAWNEQNTARTPEGRGPRPIGVKKPNELGLYDMTGNVSEWCNDWYDPDYFNVSPENDPQGPDSGEKKVRYGGSWLTYPEFCVLGVRGKIEPSGKINNLGFRVALPSK